jgi:hypothetical protein
MDEESELRARFEELRAEDQRWMPRYRPGPSRRLFAPRRLLAVAAVSFLLVVALATLVTIRSRRTTFSDSDRVAVRSIAAWRPPTEFLLRTPGSEILTTTPAIPDVAALIESGKGASR